VEAAASFGWHKYIGTEGATVTIDRFGASAPGGVCLEKFGFSADNVYSEAKKLVG
jgi:transketolase